MNGLDGNFIIFHDGAEQERGEGVEIR